MVIIQGSNNPIVVNFDRDISQCPSVEVGLYLPKAHGYLTLKEWHKADISFNENEAYIELPLSQEETLSFPSGKISLEIKALDSDNSVVVFDTILGRVEERNNEVVM